MRLIIDAFWIANCWATNVLAAPLEFFGYLLSLLLVRQIARLQDRRIRIAPSRTPEAPAIGAASTAPTDARLTG